MATIDVKDAAGTTRTLNTPLTDAELRATALPVSGTVGVTGAVAVTGPATDAQLRASALPVSMAATPGLTDTQLRASAVPVSGPATDAQLRATALPVSGPVTDAQLRATPLSVGGLTAVVSATFTRPADTTAYAQGDLVANSVTVGSVAPMALAAARANGGTGAIVRARLWTSKTAGMTGGEAFRVHLFTLSPTMAVGDNAAFAAPGLAADAFARFDVTMSGLYSDGTLGIATPAIGSQVLFKAAAGAVNVFALLEVRTAAGYTPASGEQFTLALEVLRD